MPLLAAPDVFARWPDVGSTIDELVNSRLPVVGERGEVGTERVRAILAMVLAILPQSVGSRVHFVECPSTARIGTRVAAPEPTGPWSLAAVAAVPIRYLNFPTEWRCKPMGKQGRSARKTNQPQWQEDDFESLLPSSTRAGTALRPVTKENVTEVDWVRQLFAPRKTKETTAQLSTNTNAAHAVANAAAEEAAADATTA